MTPRPQPDLDEMAAGAIDSEDIRLLEHLAELYDRADPVPPALVDRIQFDITLDALHAEVAELQRSGDLVGVRSTESDVQTVTFTSTAFSTMITITARSADEVRIDGWVAPSEQLSVELRTAGATQHTDTDEDGRFVFAAVPRGLAQFVLRRSDDGDHPPVVTPSIEL
jgi:hypothetical protein